MVLYSILNIVTMVQVILQSMYSIGTLIKLTKISSFCFYRDASTHNLRFLTIEQALADLAHFITHIKRQPRYANSNVILVGASYAATMVAWFRQLYPHLAVGAWASSAPVLAQADFIEYKEVVGAAIRHIGGQACYDRLENAFAQAEELIANGENDRFRDLFRLCDDFNADVDAGPAFSTFTDILAGVVQYHR